MSDFADAREMQKLRARVAELEAVRKAAHALVFETADGWGSSARQLRGELVSALERASKPCPIFGERCAGGAAAGHGHGHWCRVAELEAGQDKIARDLYRAACDADWRQVDAVRWALDPDLGGSPPDEAMAASADAWGIPDSSDVVVEARASVDDWTRGPDGRSNSSERYLEIVAEVEKMVGNVRLGDGPETVARLIVSQLAHVRGLAPSTSSFEKMVAAVEADGPLPTGMLASVSGGDRRLLCTCRGGQWEGSCPRHGDEPR